VESIRQHPRGRLAALASTLRVFGAIREMVGRGPVIGEWVALCVLSALWVTAHAAPLAAASGLLRAAIERSVPAAEARASQTITFNALPNKTFGNPPFTVSATASSGLPVVFSSLTTAVCTLAGNKVTIVAAGTCTIRASQSGDATYAPAPNVDRSFAVAKANQTITFGTLANKTVTSPPFTVSATASSALPVSFASLTSALCTVNVTTVTIVAAGTCTIRALQAGNANFNAAAPVSRSFTVAKLAQTIAFAPLAGKTYGTPPFTVSATASSGLPVSFASLTGRVCTVSGNTVTIVAVGTCTIQAKQAGNTLYAAAANVNQSFAVAKASQTIAFAPLADRTLGSAPFTVSANASSGLAVSFASLTTAVCTVSASTVTLDAAGTCTIQAKQAGNAYYVAAPSVSQSFTVAKAGSPATATIQYRYDGAGNLTGIQRN